MVRTTIIVDILIVGILIEGILQGDLHDFNRWIHRQQPMNIKAD
jgi:hypothetical protein